MTMASRYGPIWDAQAEVEHFEKWEAIAQKIGIDRLVCVVARVATPEELRAAMNAPGKDAVDRRCMNAIDIRRWDACDGLTRSMAAQARAAGPGGWSFSDTTCVLKHVARHHVLKVPAPEPLMCYECHGKGMPKRCATCGKWAPRAVLS